MNTQENHAQLEAFTQADSIYDINSIDVNAYIECAYQAIIDEQDNARFVMEG